MQPTEDQLASNPAGQTSQFLCNRWVAPGVFGLIGALVIAPFAHGGWLLLLDWVQGPQQHVPSSFWGLSGELTAALPFQLVTMLVSRLVGASVVSWLLLWLFFPVAGTGMARLFRSRPVPGLAAGLVYTLSPFVYERAWAGHVAFLLGMACFPSFVKALDRCRGTPSRWPVAALWLVGMIGLAPHFAFIGGLFVLCFAIANVRDRRVTIAGLAVLASAGISSIYLLVGSYARFGAVAVTSGDLMAFRTKGDPKFGLFLNVLGGYGFWRREPPLPKDDIAGWPILLTAMVVVCATPLAVSRVRAGLSTTTFVAAAAGVVGFFLALGNRGPTAWAFTTLFDHFPGFAIMREAEKFSILLVFALALLFGEGCSGLLNRTSSRRGRRAYASLLLVIPVAYNPSLFLGLQHRLKPSHYPASWSEANRVMGTGSGRVLVVPWHLYMGFGFTNGRTIANPAPGVFSRDVIFGDNAELPTVAPSQMERTRFLQYLFRRGPSLRHFGALVAPLGVEYVVVLKTVDWQAYGWLAEQLDLTDVFETPDIAVYRNIRSTPTGTTETSGTTVPNWDALVSLVDGGYSGAAFLGSGTPAEASGGPATIVPGVPLAQAGPTSYRTQAPASFAIVPEPFDPSWESNSAHAVSDAHGLAALRDLPSGAKIAYGFWRKLALSYGISLISVLFLVSYSFAVAVRKNRVP